MASDTKSELSPEAKDAFRREIQASLQSQNILIFAGLSVILVIVGLGITTFISNYVAASVNESLARAITSVETDVQSLNAKIATTLDEAKILEGKIGAIESEVDSLTTEELTSRLASVSAKTVTLEAEIAALRKSLIPDIEKIFEAKAIAADVDRWREINNSVDSSVDRMEDEISTLQYWIWGTLLAVVAFLGTVEYRRRSDTLPPPAPPR